MLNSCLRLPFTISNYRATIAYGAVLGIATETSGWAYVFQGTCGHLQGNLQELTVRNYNDREAAAEVNPHRLSLFYCGEVAMRLYNQA